MAVKIPYLPSPDRLAVGKVTDDEIHFMPTRSWFLKPRDILACREGAEEMVCIMMLLVARR